MNKTPAEQAVFNASRISGDALENIARRANTLVVRLREIHNHPQYKAVWYSYANHGGDYSAGPMYVEELKDLEASLKSGYSPSQVPDAQMELGASS